MWGVPFWGGRLLGDNNLEGLFRQRLGLIQSPLGKTEMDLCGREMGHQSTQYTLRVHSAPVCEQAVFWAPRDVARERLFRRA